MAVTADHDARDLQVQYRKFNGRGRAVETRRAVVGRHEGTDVAHQEKFARPGARQQVGHQARIAAADEQRRRVLAVVHQQPEVAAVLRKASVWKRRSRSSSSSGMGIVARMRRAYCTSGEAAASRSTPRTSACPASSCRYWRSAVAKACWRSACATAERTAS